MKNGGNKAAAAVVGKRIAEKARRRSASKRSRSTARATSTTAACKALADAAREPASSSDAHD